MSIMQECNAIDSNETIALSHNEWKVLFILIGLIVLFLYQAPYIAVFPMAMLSYVVVKLFLEKLNISKYGKITLYYNNGSAHLGGFLNIEIHTQIPYDENIRYKLVLQNIEFKAYKYSDDKKWINSSVLAEIDKEVVGENSNGFTTIKTTITIPKDGKATEYISEEYNSNTYNKRSYYWELEVSANIEKFINLKRTFKIDVIDKMGTIDRGRKRRKK